MSWDEFRDLLSGLSPDTALGRMVAIRAEEEKLGDSGRVLVRPSGTEALIRVMAEAKTEAEARKCAETLADTIKSLKF